MLLHPYPSVGASMPLDFPFLNSSALEDIVSSLCYINVSILITLLQVSVEQFNAMLYDTVK